MQRAPLVTLFVIACGGTSEPVPGEPAKVWACTATDVAAAQGAQGAPDELAQIGCLADFQLVSSPPLDGTIPGARSAKTIIDRVDGDKLHFQNSTKYPIHWDFASTNLSGNGLPIVPMLAAFNTTEYSSPSRRFVLGAVTYYEGPGKFVYEIAPYDTASAELIEQSYLQIAANAYFGEQLYFHPTSQSVSAEAAKLSPAVKIVTTTELFADVDYQPLNIAESYGRLRFVTPTDLLTEFLAFRDIAVLDQVPNDISVLSGIITATFQTPLSHINVLSKNRGTPNMALRGAFNDATLRALEGKWVRLKVGASAYEIEEVTAAVADAWWEANKPAEVGVPGLDLSVTDLRDIEQTIDTSTTSLFDAIKIGTRAFGGKAAHYGALARVQGVPSPKAFAVPVFYYMQFMAQNGFDQQVAQMLADPTFAADPAVRAMRLEQLREAMKLAPVDAAFESLLLAKLAADYPGIRMRFRSSTNAEDLDGFTGAGLYTSKSGDPNDPMSPVLDAIRKVWASVWFFRAFEERAYRSIDHIAVGMALLVHRSFPDEAANGVALTNNPFDPTGLEPAFYINVQIGEFSVVQPDPGTSTDEFLYFFDRADQPVTFISHSNLIAPGATVLTNAQMFELATALDKIRTFFSPAYSSRGDGGWWAMDVEFKFDGEPGETPALFVKQARPYL